MSTSVNGHREEESTAHTRPHGNVLPMLSFSASTPTDEENPLDNNPAIAIDVTLWEQPEDVVGGSVVPNSRIDDTGNDGQRNPETVPLIDISRDVVLIDGPNDDDEPDENAPLLTRGNRGKIGAGGASCNDDGDSGLGIPHNMPRSPEDSDGQPETECQPTSTDELREVASQLICEVISQAQVQATNTNTKKEDAREKRTSHEDSEKLMEVVQPFVSGIVAAAKEQASSRSQLPTNNNTILSSKEEAAAAAEGGEDSVKGRKGVEGMASPASNHADRIFRGGPWYTQMGRVFSSFMSRICPCRCPTKP